MEITTIGLDIAKRVFQVHGADAAGKGQLRRKLPRADVLTFFASLPPCVVGIEACATAHYWAREIRSLGHDVKLMPASYVKAYVKRGKTDAADAEAICEAVTRPTMRFVPVKTPEQQAVLMLHRTRDLLVRQRTMLVNALRSHMAELGFIAPQGISRVGDLLAVLVGEDDARLPRLARQALRGLAAEFWRPWAVCLGLWPPCKPAHKHLCFKGPATAGDYQLIARHRSPTVEKVLIGSQFSFSDKLTRS